MKQTLWRKLYTSCLISLLLIAVGGTLNMPQQNTTIAHATTTRRKYWSENKYWTKRIKPFARQRRWAHYPSINWNARDLGGYRTNNGMYTKPDKIIRGGHLIYIHNNGIRKMKKLHINEVIDIRSRYWHTGVKKMPDPGEWHNRKRGLHVAYKIYPTNTTSQEAYIARHHSPLTREYFCFGYPFTSYHSAIHSYRNIFHQLLIHKHGAIYIHCMEGHDRTGIASALILSALGVPKRTIYNDFILTDYYQDKYPYSVKINQFNHFYSVIDHRYGGMYNYLHKKIGLNHHQFQQLKRKYLINHKEY